MMNKFELITTIISIVLTVATTGLGILSKYNSKAKKFYESYIKVEEEIKKLCIIAEKNYKTGDKKKKYVLSEASRYLKINNIELDTDELNKIIESVINISKKIN